MITRMCPYNGSNYTWTVPANIDLSVAARIALQGASGGAESLQGVPGGYVEGDILGLAAGDVYQFTPGGRGKSQYTNGTGFNGGGDPGGPAAGGGGGETDVRKDGSALTQRIAVAPGGGGSSSSSLGGVGGGDNGGDAVGSTGGKGGSQTGGGAAGGGAAGAGGLGQGGKGDTATAVGAGGGAGYFGGGGGKSGSGSGTGGGGGSAWVGGLTGTIVNTPGVIVSPLQAAANGWARYSFAVLPSAPNLTLPTNIDSSIANVIPVPFDSDDDTDSITAIELRWKLAAGPWTSSGKTSSTAQQLTLAAGTWTSSNGSQLEVQARVWGQQDSASPWSASVFTTPWPPPATAFVFDPTLTGIVARQFIVTGERSDVTPIAQWRIQVVNDAAGAPGTTELADTGVVTGPAGGTTVTQTLPDVPYVNGHSYHVLVKIAYPAGVWQHAWTDIGPLAANIQPPPQPTVTKYFDPNDDQVDVELSWTVPAPTDPSLAAVHVDIERTELGVTERVATGLPVNGSWTDPYPAGSSDGVEIDYRVIAFTATGASTSSA